MRCLALIPAIALAFAPLACKSKKKRDHQPVETAGKGVSTPTTPTKPKQADGPFRLDDTAAPLAYNIELQIVPSSQVFEGTAKIDIEIKKETDIIWMHGQDLETHSVELTVGDNVLHPEVQRGPHQFLGFKVDAPLAPGKVKLEVQYSGKIVRRDGAGIFAEQDGKHWYQYTQFESLDARRAFPCFDEPRWKTPWTLAMTVPGDQIAVSNTPVAEVVEKGTSKTFKFETTKPLPTYLVAFGTGPFEFVDAGKSKNGTPLRIVTPKGRSAEATYAAEVTKQILDVLEEYFGRPYPYKKLDTLIIPTTQGFGAMEHPGLITFAARLALWNKSEETFARKRLFALVQAHEIGHQWFGNLVTMPWWDDIWLNEAFASWVENRVLAGWRPKWKLESFAMRTKERAMLADSLGSARRIREPVNDADGVESAFDAITYLKGESVLNMFETFVGRDKWRAGVIAYLEKFAWKTATAEDFLASMSEVAGSDVATPFNTFLEQNGLPLVKMELVCDKGKAPELKLKQGRYLPLGSKTSSSRQWQLPICVTHSGGSACTLLEEKTGSLALGKAGAACPKWVNPNKGGVGYYRAEMPAPMREALLKAAGKLSLAESLTMINDRLALVRNGAVPIGEAFELAKLYAQNRDPVLNQAAVELAIALDALIEDDKHAAYRRFLTDAFGGLVGRVGWKPRTGEAPHVSEMRPLLLKLVGGIAGEKEAVRSSLASTRQWLETGEAIDPAMFPVVLVVAARNGDQALFDALSKRAIGLESRNQRREALAALSQFRITDSARETTSTPGFAVSLSTDIDPREGIEIIYTAGLWRETRAAIVDFVMKNYDQLATRLSEAQLGNLPDELDAICSAELRKKLVVFLADRMRKLPGGELELKQAAEKIDLCIASRTGTAKAAAEVLESEP